MNHSLLLSILLIEFSIIIPMCVTMTFFILRNKDNRKDKKYKYYFRYLSLLYVLGLTVMALAFFVKFVVLDRSNNSWISILVIFLTLYIVLLAPLVVHVLLMLSNYELNERKEGIIWEEEKNNYLSNEREHYLSFSFSITIVSFILCILILNFAFKITLYWLVLALLLTLIVAMIFVLALVVRNIANNNVSINNTNNVTIVAVISISLALGLIAWGSISASAAMELPGAPNGLSKKIDDLEKSNHRIEAKLKKERKTNIQNKKYIKKVVKESHKTNINIKKITNNTTINRIMKSKPHDPRTPIKKSPSPKKPPYQDPKGKLPDTGEAKGFWQW